MEATDGLKLLRAPFPANQISYLPKGGVKLAYVGHAALTDRLLDADPAWMWEPLSMADNGLPVMDDMGGMWIRLTVCGVTRLGYGHAGTKTGGDAIKEVIGDALRNAAMRFGAALDLWHKGDLHGDETLAATLEASIAVAKNAKGVPHGKGSVSPAKQAFDLLSPEVQATLRKGAPHVVAAMPDAAKAVAIFEMVLDEFPEEDRQDNKAGLWSLLDSATRSAMKREAAKTTTTEEVTQ